MKYLLIILICVLTIGCHRYSDMDYATENCDIKYNGICFFQNRISAEDYDEDKHFNIFIGDGPCTLITPDTGCISGSDEHFQIRIQQWTKMDYYFKKKQID